MGHWHCRRNVVDVKLHAVAFPLPPTYTARMPQLEPCGDFPAVEHDSHFAWTEVVRRHPWQKLFEVSGEGRE